MKKLTKEEIQEIFNSNNKKIYKKKGVFIYRKAIFNESILTIVSGRLETIKKSNANDIIIRNIEIGSSAETYIIDENKFKSRYECTTDIHIIDGNTWKVAKATGKCEAIEYKGEEIQFEAPWGELMLCNYNDFIAKPLPGEATDIYRIERETFFKTYEEIKI